MADGPLTGIKVVEITTFQQGPVAGMRLGDLGADVIKIEPKEGDPARRHMRTIEAEFHVKGDNYYFEHANRNKRGIGLDMKNEKGMAGFLKLIDSADEIKRAVVGPTLKTKLELKEIILHHPKLEAFMSRRSRSSGQEIWKVRKEADEYLEEIAATYSYTLVHIGEKILTWIWNNLFDGIDVDAESMQKVKKAARSNTLVYIPCHKRHIDYLDRKSVV
jgi:hypothetical protein